MLAGGHLRPRGQGPLARHRGQERLAPRRREGRLALHRSPDAPLLAPLPPAVARALAPRPPPGVRRRRRRRLEGLSRASEVIPRQGPLSVVRLRLSIDADRGDNFGHAGFTGARHTLMGLFGDTPLELDRLPAGHLLRRLGRPTIEGYRLLAALGGPEIRLIVEGGRDVAQLRLGSNPEGTRPGGGLDGPGPRATRVQRHASLLGSRSLAPLRIPVRLVLLGLRSSFQLGHCVGKPGRLRTIGQLDKHLQTPRRVAQPERGPRLLETLVESLRQAQGRGDAFDELVKLAMRDTPLPVDEIRSLQTPELERQPHVLDQDGMENLPAALPPPLPLSPSSTRRSGETRERRCSRTHPADAR